jgi:hypothetical protein
MARIRSVKPELRTSAVVTSWPMEVRYFFVLLWGYLDDKGRGLDVPKQIAGDCFPYDEKVSAAKVDGWLDLMGHGYNGEQGPVCRYTVNGKRYVHCVNWGEHQRPNRPTPSRLPPCPIHELPKHPREPLSEPSSERLSESVNGNSRTGAEEQGRREAEELRGSLRSPPRADAAEPQTAEPGDAGAAETILRSWIAACAKPPLARIVNDVGRQIAAMLAEGADPADVAEGIRLWQRRGLHPSTLPSVVHQIMNSPPPEQSNVVALRQDRRPSTTDQRVADALALGEEIARELQ